MSKKITLKEKEDEVLEPLTHTALGVYKNEENGEWMVAKLLFNPQTGKAELVEHIYAGPGRQFGIEKFKLVAVNEGIVG